jgi:hypothetical protein
MSLPAGPTINTAKVVTKREYLGTMGQGTRTHTHTHAMFFSFSHKRFLIFSSSKQRTVS